MRRDIKKKILDELEVIAFYKSEKTADRLRALDSLGDMADIGTRDEELRRLDLAISELTGQN